ncbi:hypothetical protein BU14_0353s0020 [Porphyra umbilicalis]|uniref:Uncharacterized protein n=1 Tax=Porphyra umbilicalis TaxID=2786 RepID=A0A1X6NY01_PORUM|nr:hypothetical protein BU14_0353s0020 [Porphyra umbilicalis]|eukprot:OSX73376.1 hypothetical protein BU14_0353s0020 [Porphyra umbilicalis]
MAANRRVSWPSEPAAEAARWATAGTCPLRPRCRRPQPRPRHRPARRRPPETRRRLALATARVASLPPRAPPSRLRHLFVATTLHAGAAATRIEVIVGPREALADPSPSTTRRARPPPARGVRAATLGATVGVAAATRRRRCDGPRLAWSVDGDGRARRPPSDAFAIAAVTPSGPWRFPSILWCLYLS